MQFRVISQKCKGPLMPNVQFNGLEKHWFQGCCMTWCLADAYAPSGFLPKRLDPAKVFAAHTKERACHFPSKCAVGLFRFYGIAWCLHSSPRMWETWVKLPVLLEGLKFTPPTLISRQKAILGEITLNPPC